MIQRLRLPDGSYFVHGLPEEPVGDALVSMEALTASGKSAATGRPHFFGRLYEDGPTCLWCGNGRDHEWHITETTLTIELRQPEGALFKVHGA